MKIDTKLGHLGRASNGQATGVSPAASENLNSCIP